MERCRKSTLQANCPRTGERRQSRPGITLLGALSGDTFAAVTCHGFERVDFWRSVLPEGHAPEHSEVQNPGLDISKRTSVRTGVIVLCDVDGSLRLTKRLCFAGG